MNAQIGAKVTEYRFPRNPHPTPVAELPALVEIITKLDCDVARQLASIQAQLFTGHVGGSLNQAVETLQNHVAQQAETPGGLLGQFAQHVQETGGNNLANSGLRLAKQRSNWREERVKEKELSLERHCGMKSLPMVIPSQTNMAISDRFNKAALGFADATTGAFKRRNQINEKHPLMDYATDSQVVLKSLAETVLRDRIQKNAPADADELKAIVNTTYNQINNTGAVMDIHFSENNPFRKLNRRLKMPEEKLLIEGPTVTTTVTKVTKPSESVSERHLFEAEPFPTAHADVHAVRLVMSFMQSLFHTNVMETRDKPNDRDHGLDIVSNTGVAQVKAQFSSSISETLMSSFHSQATVRRPDKKTLLYFAPSFTGEAREFAELTKISLFVLDKSGNIKPSNDAAIKICEDADAQERSDLQRMRTRANSRVLKELDLGSASRRAKK